MALGTYITLLLRFLHRRISLLSWEGIAFCILNFRRGACHHITRRPPFSRHIAQVYQCWLRYYIIMSRYHLKWWRNSIYRAPCFDACGRHQLSLAWITSFRDYSLKRRIILMICISLIIYGWGFLSIDNTLTPLFDYIIYRFRRSLISRSNRGPGKRQPSKRY